ncbi:S41 family peptidase [Caulobacter sp.]|uniref:S41 family peptidase n=1 Tax=Caulobacter sp. TaxID=78 RepID=UPI001B17C002|nr:S41 family peptidase [Caulobacter sp.]MBO9547375.1 S41 family peptidase [Caulobacter sp.]
MKAPLLAVLALSAPFALSAPVAAENAYRPVVENGQVAGPLQGAWRSRGYGWIAMFGPGGSSLFQTAGKACYPDPRSQPDPDEVLALWRPEAEGVVALAGEADGTRYLFDRLDHLPNACISAAGWTPDRIGLFAADTFAQFYPASAARRIDWSARRAAIAGRLNPKSTDTDLWNALSDLLAGLDDPHVELHGVVDGKQRDLEPGEAPTLARVRAADPKGGEKAWLRAYRDGVMTGVLKGQGRQVANNRIFWGRIDDVGYINIVTMGGFDKDPANEAKVLEATLDEAMTAFKGARAVIVDVSNNRGGYDVLGRAVASRFTDQPRLAYDKVGVGADAPPQPVVVEVATRPAFTGPVYLVTSDVTVSAGETFTLMMRALPNVRQVGGITRGAFSDKIPKPLPNGWTLALPAELYRDPQGRVVEGKGLAPDLPLNVFPANDLSAGHAKAIEGLMARIRAGDATLKAPAAR